MTKMYFEVTNVTREIVFGVPYKDDMIWFHVIFNESEMDGKRIVTIIGDIHENGKLEEQTLIGKGNSCDSNEFTFKFDVEEKMTLTIDIYEDDTHRCVNVSY